jgi:uncharacterized membrane protein
MEAYLLDWGNLLLRWLHVITAIAWIGSSFYFVFLDNSLEPPTDEALKAKGVTGEMWAVHGGGFYNPQKYALGPKQMPPNKLHWFYWESYATWLSGFALFALLYLWNASSFLVDRNVYAWPSNGAAIGVALAFLFVGWIVYDLVCRVARGRAVGALIALCVVAASWLACELFAGRAAFLVIGAMLGTIMTANVAHWIIPGQRKVVADIAAGRTPDPVHGQRGKQRSVHNTYFTLPVLVAMLGNHYPMLTQHRHNWVVLVLLMLLGALVRQFFVLRHQGRNRWELVAASIAIVTGLVVFVAPQRSATVEAPQPAGLAQVQAIVQQRCVMCHNTELAQKGVMLHTPERITQQAQAIYQQVVVSRQMPQNNATQMTEAERALVARWFAGAR